MDHNCCPCVCGPSKETGEIIHLPAKSQAEAENIVLRDKTIREQYAKIHTYTNCPEHNGPEAVTHHEMDDRINAFEHKEQLRDRST